MKSRMMTSAWVLGILSVLIISGQCGVTANKDHYTLNAGPYVDTIVYKILPNQDQRVLALQSGEIEMDTGFFNQVHLDTLTADPDIDIVTIPRNGYGVITINCRDYPLNISGLRRAFAFAYDKTIVTRDVMDGFSLDHDSLVPYPSIWCVEDNFDWHYYSDDTDMGNQILDDLGFQINTTTGFRHAPNGEPFNITIEYLSGAEIAGGPAAIGVDALRRLHINANYQYADFTDLFDRLNNHGEYDMYVSGINFEDADVDWLAYEYWSEYADVPSQNPTNFMNATYDSWRNQLLYGTTYEEVYEAAAEMQNILHYNVPRLVVYENIYLQAYRNDQFTGHVEDLANGISGLWTTRNIHKIDSTFGGTVPIAISEMPESFNIFTAELPETKAILDNIYSSLYRLGPDLQPIPDLAKSMIIETHTDNPNVPEGHTRFTIDIIQEAMWTDGTDLTAKDVVSSIIYVFESANYGNPAGSDIGELAAAYAPTPYQAVIEFNTESYWHFSNFAYDYILPEHIFNDDTGIGFDNWDSWNPVFDPTEPLITYGPFHVSDYERDEFIEISYSCYYYFAGVEYIFGIRGPMLGSQGNITYYYGTIGNEIVWSIFDYNPTTYSIQIDGREIRTGQYVGFNLRHNVDGLELGNYTFTLNATNELGFSSINTVGVSVLAFTGKSLLDASPLIILTTSISVASAIVILTYAISFYRDKRTPKAG